MFLERFCDWLKILAPFSRPIRSKTKTNWDLPARGFSRAWHGINVFSSSSDWLIGVSASVLIGYSLEETKTTSVSRNF